MPAQADLATKPSLTLKRHLNASPEAVYAAWTDPEKIVKLFGPDSGPVTHAPTARRGHRPMTVFFSYIVYKSRAHRDLVNAMPMKDPRVIGTDVKDMPFDGKSMIYGGFKVSVDL